MKHTPGPWLLEFMQKWPFGIRIKAGTKEILKQDAFCFSSAQKTRKDCENGVGFQWKNEKFTNREEAMSNIAEQDANARLIAAAPDLLEACEAALSEMMHFGVVEQKRDDGRGPCDVAICVRCKVEAAIKLTEEA